MGIGDWGLGIGDWGLGIGDWPNPQSQSPIPNPQSPIPNPQKEIIICLFEKISQFIIKTINKIYLYIKFILCLFHYFCDFRIHKIN